MPPWARCLCMSEEMFCFRSGMWHGWVLEAVPLSHQSGRMNSCSPGEDLCLPGRGVSEHLQIASCLSLPAAQGGWAPCRTLTGHSGELIRASCFDGFYPSLFGAVCLSVIGLQKFFIYSGHSSFDRHVLCKHLPGNSLFALVMLALLRRPCTC